MYTHPGKRPRYLNLMAFKFPLNAKLSIMHRITGVFLLISIVGYIALLHLILLHPTVTLATVSDHCIIRCLSTVFWISLSFHWLAGLRHMLAEHFLNPNQYARINSRGVSYLLLIIWAVLSFIIVLYFWIL